MVEPLVRFEPPATDYELGVQATELAASCGLVLDAEQELVIRGMLARDERGRFAAFECGVVEPRQNGKGGIIEARKLAAVELVASDRLVIYSAHEYATAMEAFGRMQMLLEQSDIRIRRLRTAHGEQGIDFANGTRLRYRTRTKGGGRGFSCDLLVLDEAMELPEKALAALLPTLSARENPQVVYAGSAVDQITHTEGVVLSRVRERGIAGDSDRLAYYEWALAYDHPDEVPGEVLCDPESWRKANPALGSRIAEAHVAAELEAMSARTFAVERLGVGDWPATDAGAGSVIPLDLWEALEDQTSQIFDPVCLAWDVSPDRNGAIAAAGKNEQDLWHVELVDARPGTAWIPERLVELARSSGPLVIACDERGPGASLIARVSEELDEAGFELQTVTAAENAQACGLLVDAVNEATIRHLGDPRISNALRGAGTRPLGDSWSWARRHSSANIAPLFAITLALWATMGCPDTSAELVIY